MAKAELNPLRLFEKMSREVPAYRKFIKQRRIKKVKELQDIPVMEKKSYVSKYDFKQRIAGKKLPAMAYSSSGSSGQPTFWFRDDLQEEQGSLLHEKIFRENFGIKKDEPTLVVIIFSMGVWIAGNYTLACCRGLSRLGYNITTITPGIDKEDALQSIEKLVPHFKNLVVAGHPPFVLDIFNSIVAKQIKLPKNVGVFTAGDSFDENWRDNILKLAKQKEPAKVVSIYGAADTGIMGYETPFSIYLRRLALKHPDLYQALFGDSEKLPVLVQYDSAYVYLEEVGEELAVTTNTTTPLLRYNIHDIGRVISHNQMAAILKDLGLLKNALAHGLKKWKTPFVTKSGRTDVAVTYYALNIYPEQIRTVTEDVRLSKFLSGNYIAYSQYDRSFKREKLVFKFELTLGVKDNEKLGIAVQATLIKNLLRLNSEYRKLTASIGEKAVPEVRLFESGKGIFKPEGAKALLQIKGKKARMML